MSDPVKRQTRPLLASSLPRSEVEGVRGREADPARIASRVSERSDAHRRWVDDAADGDDPACRGID
jgi:hypothetical protein